MVLYNAVAEGVADGGLHTCTVAGRLQMMNGVFKIMNIAFEMMNLSPQVQALTITNTLTSNTLIAFSHKLLLTANLS